MCPPPSSVCVGGKIEEFFSESGERVSRNNLAASRRPMAEYCTHDCAFTGCVEGSKLLMYLYSEQFYTKSITVQNFTTSLGSGI
jgi:hypothetical protein